MTYTDYYPSGRPYTACGTPHPSADNPRHSDHPHPPCSRLADHDGEHVNRLGNRWTRPPAPATRRVLLTITTDRPLDYETLAAVLEHSTAGEAIITGIDGATADYGDVSLSWLLLHEAPGSIRPGAACPVCRAGILTADTADPRLTVCVDCGAVPTGVDNTDPTD